MTVEMVKNKSNFFLFFATITANVISFSSGNSFAWSATTIPKLDGTDTLYPNPLEVNATLLESSWIVSLMSLGATCGPILGGTLAGRIGRKNTLLVCCLPMIASHVIIMFGNTVEHFYVSRFLVGIGIGISYTTVPMYIGEIAEVHNRGLLGCMFSLASVTGNMFVFLLGPFLSVEHLSLIILIPLPLFLIIFGFFIPETPYYLVSANKIDAALQSLTKIRRRSADVATELSNIKSYIEKSQSQNMELKDLIFSKALKKSLIISIGLVFAQQFSGVTPIYAYLTPIFNLTSGTIPPQYATMIVGLVQIITVLLTTQLIDKVGRKILLQISTTGTVISLGALGIYFYFQDNNYDVSSISWLPIISVIVYMFSYSLGIGPITWAIIGELFPTNVKALASTITVSVCLGLAFLTALSYPIFCVHLTMAGTFWFFAVLSFFSLLFMTFVLPETKGKTFEEIQALINEEQCENNNKEKLKI